MDQPEGFEPANRKAREKQATHPMAESARYDRRTKRIVIQLSSGLGVTFSPRDVEGLEQGSPEELAVIEISPSGFGIHFPRLDADLYLPALLEGFLGSEKWMSSRFAALGGRSRSAAKALAARENGRLGGRPKGGAKPSMRAKLH